MTNLSSRRRFGVKVELKLLDGDRKQVGVASDYVAVLEANAAWTFRALVVDAGTVTAEVSGIKEMQ